MFLNIRTIKKRKCFLFAYNTKHNVPINMANIEKVAQSVKINVPMYDAPYGKHKVILLSVL